MLTDQDTILDTPRLILRHWTESDAEDLYLLASDPLVGPGAGWRPHESLAFSRTVLRTVYLSRPVFAMVPKKGVIAGACKNAPIGNISLTLGPMLTRDIAEGEAELGYWIGTAYRRMGLTEEAVREVIRYAFEDLNIRRLICSSFEDNTPSLSMIGKLGFHYLRTVHDIYNPMLGEVKSHKVFYLDRAQ
ncbi:GNAT family N-acetyltransferase [Butyrivibrio sp. MC2013]|uniref:GNAT family N-acetyltransferase n=1 Tax=Butyrivibrio sp. MC2013 TaxID=1280686 RepID=UPI000568136A|nr:GNAT family N-acetyltransferase [Butyrivibrio sp. MC2013]